MIAFKNEDNNELIITENGIIITNDDIINNLLKNELDREVADFVKAHYKEKSKVILKELLINIYNSEYQAVVNEFIEEINKVNNQNQEIIQTADLSQQTKMYF